jgi:uncharacterized protein YidB (DUF937 family)
VSGLENMLGGLLGGKGGGLAGVLGGLAGGGRPGLGSGAGGAAMLTALVPLVGGLLAGGGLNRLLSGFQAQGLGSHADSWVGKGENQPVDGEQVRQVIGDEQVAEIAQKLGVSHDAAAQAIAEVLPHVVDHVTPDGSVPPAQDVDTSLGQLQQAAAQAARQQPAQ